MVCFTGLWSSCQNQCGSISNVAVTKGIGAQTIKVTSTHIPLEYGERATFKGNVKPNLLLSGTTESNQLPFKLATVVVGIEMETDHYYIQYIDQAWESTTAISCWYATTNPFMFSQRNTVS